MMMLTIMVTVTLVGVPLVKGRYEHTYYHILALDMHRRYICREYRTKNASPLQYSVEKGKGYDVGTTRRDAPGTSRRW